ncbi:MAG: leucine-rich repeat protein [Clostridia bacterium]|nr:leucine-rich repeat protein [Clostridia bacterium]
MGYIQAQCSNCGAQLEINEEKGRGYCPHCGTLFIAEKVTNNQVYSTTQNITKNIYGREKSEAEDFIANGDVFLSLDEFAKAKNAFDKAIELNPSDWRGWFGMVKVKTKNLTDYYDNMHLDDLDKAHSVACDVDDQMIDKLYEQYGDTRRAMLLKRKVDGDKLNDFYEFSSSPATHSTAVMPTRATVQYPYTTTPGYSAEVVKKKQKKHNKKALAIILPIVFIFALFSLVGGIRGWFNQSDFEYEVNESGNLTITGINIDEEDVIIPNIIDGKRVVAIGERAFEGNTDIRNVTIPSSVTSIEDNAFSNCTSLVYLHLLGVQPPTLGYAVFSRTNGYGFWGTTLSITIYVPRSSVHDYMNSSDWMLYASSIEEWKYID